MKKHLSLPVICFLLLVLLVAVPALAATVTCPSSCSCLLPAEAKNLGYSGYCGDKQQVCGYDMQKNEKYCYTKPVKITTIRTVIVTVRPFVTTTTTPAPVPVTCPSGCSCFTLEEGKKNGYSLCGGKQILCGYDTTRQPQYCHQPPVSVTTTTTISVIRDVPRVPTKVTTAVPVRIKGVSGSPCFETYIESGSLKINNDGFLMCSVQITSRDGSGAVLLQEGTEVSGSNNHPIPKLIISRTELKDLSSVHSDEKFRYVGYAYDCLPDGTRFDDPVMISISPSQEDWSTMNGDDLIIRGFNSGESRWENQSTTIHANERKITAELSHFSIFALFSRQSIENTSSSNNTTITQPAGIQWKGTPLSLVIPMEYAPLAAVTFGMLLIIGGGARSRFRDFSKNPEIF